MSDAVEKQIEVLASAYRRLTTARQGLLLAHQQLIGLEEAEDHAEQAVEHAVLRLLQVAGEEASHV